MTKQLVTATFVTEGDVDAATVVAKLADQARYVNVQVAAPKYATAQDITFVSATPIEDTETADVA